MKNKPGTASATGGIERRSFLKGSALAAGVALLEACGRDDVQYLVQPLERPEGRPGESVWKRSVCGQCAAGCGTMVRLVDGDARKVEGLRTHPINHGGLCALGQAALQGHYDPDRVAAPMARPARSAPPPGDRHGESAAEGDRGPIEVVTWEIGLARAAEALAKAAASDPSSILFVDGSGNAFLHALLARLARAIGAPAPIALLAPEVEVERQAAATTLGFDGLAAYDLPRADYILSIGPAFLDRGHQPAWATWAMAQVRGGVVGRRGKLVQAEARMSLTAAFADEWLPVKPGEEGTLARAIAGVLLAEAPQRGNAAAYAALYPEPAPTLAEAARRCDLPEKKILRIARELARAERPVVLGGGSAALLPDGLAHTQKALALNLLLGSVRRAGGVYPSASFGVAASLHQDGAASSMSINALETRLRGIGGVPRVLVVCDGDPAHTRPAARGWRDGLGKVETVIALTTALDDTAAQADVVLPVHSDIERFQAAEPTGLAFPVLSLAEPAVKPLGASRHPGDVVLALASALDHAAALPWESFAAMVEQTVTERAGTLPGSASAEASQVWRDALERGGIWNDPLAEIDGAAAAAGAIAGAAPGATAGAAAAPTRRRGTPVLREAIVGESITSEAPPAAESGGAEPTKAEPIDAEPAEAEPAIADEFTLLLFESAKYGDGRGANKSWLQELPDTLTTVMWSGWAEIASRDAERLGVVTGDRVEVATANGAIEVPAVVRPEARPGTVALPLGPGYRDYGRYARGRGANPLDLVGVATVEGTTAPALSGQPAQVRRTGTTQVAIFGRGLREAEHIPVGWAAMKNKGHQP